MSRRALAASRSQEAFVDLTSDDEDDDLDAPLHIKEPNPSKAQSSRKDGGPDIQLGKLGKGTKHIASSSVIQDQPRERSTRMKRKAEEELSLDGVKPSTSISLATKMSSAISSGSISPPKITCEFLAS